MKLFMSGYKPAYYDTILSNGFMKYLPTLVQKYPYLNQGVGLIEDTTTYMFFQNEDLKNSFQTQIKNITLDHQSFTDF